MPMNIIYRGPADLPQMIPVFPLPGALLLPRGQMPLNIFEPRYLAMVDDAIAARHRLIGMIQPDTSHPAPRTSRSCSRSAAPAASPRSPRPATAVTCCSSPGWPASASRRNRGPTPYRQCRVNYPVRRRLRARKGEDAVDRKALLGAHRFLKANKLKTDWEGVESAPNEALVNALAMMSP